MKVTVPFALKKTEPAVENLRRCGNLRRGLGGPKPFTHRFVSSDLYKVMEGAAYLLMIERDPALERQLDKIIAVIAAAQRDDGYLYVRRPDALYQVLPPFDTGVGVDFRRNFEQFPRRIP